MRDGYRIIDTDTHVGPSVETLEQFAGPVLRERWNELDVFRQPSSEGGHHLSIHPFPYRRKLGTRPDGELAAATGGASPLKGSVSRTSLPTPYTPGVNDLNSAGRLADMDKEGVDVHLVIPGTFVTAVSALDPSLAREIWAAYRRYIEAYCAADTERLKATVPVAGADPEAAAVIVHEQARLPHVAAATVVLPEGLPVDDPTLEPIWRAMNEHDLPLLHHSFFYEPPYFPGYRDIWGNVVVARAAAHPWGAERLTAYCILSGLFDRYPNLRLGFAECSAGWLPGWLVRLGGQKRYMRHAVPETKLDDPLDYARAGHVFCGIELYEGETLARSIVDVVGEDVLMYQSDYPHPGGEFPDSPAVVLGWTSLGDGAMRRLLSGNAERFLRL
jgi:predicted TIM-barrel fold metal-dependent hydrolase